MADLTNVLFVTTTYPLHRGDAIPAFVADLAKSLVRTGHIRVKVIAPHHPGAALRETVEGVQIERFQYTLDPEKQCVAYGGGIPDNLRNFPRAKWQLPGFFFAMARAVWNNLKGIDLIHAHWIEPAFLASLANHKGLPMVLSIHSLKPRGSIVGRHTLAKMDRVLFNSQYTLGQARQKGYRFKGQVAYQGYDDRLFGSVPRLFEVRSALGIPGNAIMVVALGRMIEVKGLHVLAQAADQFMAARPEVHLVIAGDGPQRGEIERLVQQSVCSTRIHLPGAMARRQVANLLADADLFVNPGVIDSRGRAEGLGITTIEAMASGLACVGSRVGGITETITEGVTGLLVPPGDAGVLARSIGQLVDDPALRRRMGMEAARIAQERFTWRVLARQVAGVYEEVLAEDRRMKAEG